jgi:hypothetical protein
MSKFSNSKPRGARERAAAEFSIRIGKRAAMEASITNGGLLAVGALVSGVLLSTAVVVFVAGRRTTKAAQARLPAPGNDPALR